MQSDVGFARLGRQSVDKFEIFTYNSRRANFFGGATRNDGIARLNPSLRCAPFRLLYELVDGLIQSPKKLCVVDFD